MTELHILGLILALIPVVFFIGWKFVQRIQYNHFQKRMGVNMLCKVKELPEKEFLGWVYWRKTYIGKIENIHGAMQVQVRFVRPAKTPDGYLSKVYLKKYVYPR